MSFFTKNIFFRCFLSTTFFHLWKYFHQNSTKKFIFELFSFPSLAFYQKVPASLKIFLWMLSLKIFSYFSSLPWKFFIPLNHKIREASSSDSEWKFNFDTKQLYSTHKLEIDFVPISFFLLPNSLSHPTRMIKMEWEKLCEIYGRKLQFHFLYIAIKSEWKRDKRSLRGILGGFYRWDLLGVLLESLESNLLEIIADRFHAHYKFVGRSKGFESSYILSIILFHRNYFLKNISRANKPARVTKIGSQSH